MAATHPHVESSSASSPGGSRFTPEYDSDDGLDQPKQSIRMTKLRNADSGEQSEEEASFLPQHAAIESFELFSPEEDKAVLRKLDKRLVLFMALLYMLSFLDRSNIGNARIAGLMTDLELSSDQYEWLLTGFYIAYISFQWMALMYRLVPPHIYISLCVLSWGVLASLQSVATSFPTLLIIRVLLAISEAAYGNGVPFYLSFFFRREELALRTGYFIAAAPLATSFASSLAYLITKLGAYGPIAPWRLLFLIEGFPSIVVAVIAWRFVPDSPNTTRWLTLRERKVAVLRLQREKEAQETAPEKHDRASSARKLDIREIVRTLTDPKSYLMAGMFFSTNVAFSSMPVFLPTIVKEMGYSSINSQALSAPPYLVAFIAVLVTAALSDRTKSRSTFIMLHSLLAGSGYALLVICGLFKLPVTVRYFGLYPACVGFFSVVTLVLTWTVNNHESDSGKGTGLTILGVIGQCGPLVGVQLFPDKDQPYYIKGMATCAAFMLLVGILAGVLRIVLQKENQKRLRKYRSERIEADNEDGEAVEEPFLFIL